MSGYVGTWKNRRRVIFGSLIFCAATVGYLAAFGQDTRLNETIAFGCFGLAGLIIPAYVFGAVIDDKNIMQARS